MGAFDHSRSKLSSSAKLSGPTTNRFGPRKVPTPQVDPAPQTDSSEHAPIQPKLERDENGNPAWWSRLSFDPPARYGMQTPVQTKLTIGQPDDQYEQEADRIAAEVVNQISAPQPAPIQREDNLEEEIQTKPLAESIAPLVQREETKEEDLQMMPMQRVAEAGGMDASPDLESSIAQAKGGGQPLDQSIRAPIEQAMGADFSGVKVHTDTQADQLNRSVQAKAFTTGQDVFFRQGEYNPGSRGGQELIAHELTHVVQQNGGVVQRSPLPLKHSATETLFASTGDRRKCLIESHEKSSVVQLQTIGEIIMESFNNILGQLNNLANAMNTTPQNLANALLDPAFHLEGSVEFGTINQDIQDPLNFASCYPTAEHLFPLLTDNSQQVGQGANLEAYASGDEFRASVEQLITLMQNSIGAATAGVFRIEYAGHGFTLISRPNNTGNFQIELIESLAHSAPIGPSLERPAFDPNAIYQNLRDMASDNVGIRIAGASRMGWNANALYLGRDATRGNREDFPRVRLRWWANALSPNWRNAWGRQVGNRYNFLAERVGINDRI